MSFQQTSIFSRNVKKNHAQWIENSEARRVLVNGSGRNFIKLLQFESAHTGYSSLQRETERGFKRCYRMPKCSW